MDQEIGELPCAVTTQDAHNQAQPAKSVKEPEKRPKTPAGNGKRKRAPKGSVAREIRRRRDSVPLVLVTTPTRWLIDEADRRGWRIQHWWSTETFLPPGAVPRGALVDVSPDRPRAKHLRKRGIPVVRVGLLPHPKDDVIPAVLPDLHAEGCMAAEYFFNRGFRHVGHISNTPLGDLKPLFEGLNDRARELGMACHLHRPEVPAEGESASDAAFLIRRRSAMMAWVDKLPKPVGMLADEDILAEAICNWQEEVGFNIPADVAVVSRGLRPELCLTAIPRLSSFERNEAGRAHAACDLLARMMAGEAPPTEPIMIPPKPIVTRASTEILAVDDPRVARALVFMWEHLDLDLSVDDIAREVGVSRRSLERAFCACLDRGINAELQRKRLEVFHDKLVSTDLPIAHLASMVGFRSIAHLRRSFRSAYGLSAREYRAGVVRAS